MTNPENGAARIDQLRVAMADAELDLVAIAPTPNMRYLIGFAPLHDERPCLLLVGRQAVSFLVPELNVDQVEAHTGMSTIRWTDAEGPHGALEAALGELGLDRSASLAADSTMRADVLLLLQETLRPVRSVSAGDLMMKLRIRKSEAELETMARAARQADAALLAGADACRPGVTELEVAEVIAAQFRREGAETIDFLIVASGPNGAYPHHETGNRRLEPNDTVLIDIGATLDGYKSDVCRMVQLGEPPEEVMAAYEAVLEANRLGREAAVAGALARDVDRAARQSLEKAGYGDYFVHRTGHGLGMEGHEPPWITSESETRLEPGMVFSVEPGVYLTGEFGIRIEDIIAVTEGDPRRLTGLDHAMIMKT